MERAEELAVKTNQLIPEANNPLAFARMFLTPLVTLESLSSRPQWLLPLLCAATCAAAVNHYVVERIGLAQLVTAVARSSAAIDPEAIMENAVANQTQIMIFQAVSSFLGVVFTALFVGLILWLLVLVTGADAGYKNVLAVVAHAALFTTIVRQSMLALMVSVTSNFDGFNLSNPLATNLAFFLRPDSHVFSRILASLDVIVLANLFFLIFGLAKVCHGLSRAAAFAVVVIPWSIYIAFFAWMPWLP